MLDGLFNFFASLLALFYNAWPSYAGSIFLLTMLVNLVATPLTLKATRSSIEMQRWAPEIKRIQKEYADDREEQSAQMMAFYKEHNINPLGGCLPQLVMAPIFLVLYNVMRGLFRRFNETNATDEFPVDNFNPKYLDSCCSDSDLINDLKASNEAVSMGFDISRTAMEMIRENFVSSLPYLVLILVVFLSGWFQQKQIMGRSNSSSVNSQQQMIMKFLPFMLPVFSFSLPAGLVLYFVFGNLYRLALQTFITRRYYSDDPTTDGVVESKEKASDTVSAKGSKSAKATKSAAAAGATGAKNGAKGGSKNGSKNGSKDGAAGTSSNGGGSKPAGAGSKHGRRTDGGERFGKRPRTEPAKPAKASKPAAKSKAKAGGAPSEGSGRAGGRVTAAGTTTSQNAVPKRKRKKKK
jgi:YidC/Oxa1 family membrane protein insertase